MPNTLFDPRPWNPARLSFSKRWCDFILDTRFPLREYLLPREKSITTDRSTPDPNRRLATDTIQYVLTSTPPNPYFAPQFKMSTTLYVKHTCIMSTVLQGNVFVVGLWSQEVSKVYGKKLLYNLPDKKFLSDNDMYL